MNKEFYTSSNSIMNNRATEIMLRNEFEQSRLDMEQAKLDSIIEQYYSNVRQENTHLKQALNEIREYVNKQIELNNNQIENYKTCICTNINGEFSNEVKENMKHSMTISACIDYKMEDILQIIDKVLGDDEK